MSNTMAAIDMPSLPVSQDRFIEHVAGNPCTPIPDLLEPFHRYENELRKVFAQQPDHVAAKQSSVVPIFGGYEQDVKIRSRDLDAESDQVRETYIMPLKNTERKPDGAPAIAKSLPDFRTQFNLFTESSLADLNWDNVVVAGSAVVTPLLSVPEEHAGSKRSLRRYYHEIVAPASDVDLFLYDLTEEQAIEKIKQIEKNVRDALLVETTTIRTKNTITIASQYPVRHVQIVLRIYKSITEILTGFDVDCSCAAYDGKQVWASPRALASYMTQTNTIDLTRRSPSYENRLSKYRHRGFEVRFPELDRSRIDPTIYERSFARTEGLARLLILEKLPKSSEREAYIDQRRLERGRPAADRSRMRQHITHGDLKNKFEDEVAEWVDTDEVSSYHTFSIPYGPRFHAKKIEKLVYTKDLLLNAEWNNTKREVNLHRHPAFFGSVEDVIGDCCGSCPTPVTIEEEEVAEQESKIYVSGEVVFMKDNCGRQAIGSFNPLSPEQYTDMAYVGNTQLLCQAIIDLDLNFVEQWLSQEGNDPNTRDHTGRAPLHLAVSCSTLQIVQSLIDHGAKLVARLVDGKTALHLACIRGDTQMVAALLKKSEANLEEESNRTDAKRKARLAAKETRDPQDADIEMIEAPEADSDVDAMTEGSVVDVQTPKTQLEGQLDGLDDETTDVLDVNVLAWDTASSPLHLAILGGHFDVVKCLVQDFGADVLLPMKLPPRYEGGPPNGVLLTLSLAQRLPLEHAKQMTRLLFDLGASCAQADPEQRTALDYCVGNQPALLETHLESDPTGAARALKHYSVQGSSWRPEVLGPLLTAIANEDSETALRLLAAGARASVPFEAYLKGIDKTAERSRFDNDVEQPVIVAVEQELPLVAAALVEHYKVDCNTLTTNGWKAVHSSYGDKLERSGCLLDHVKAQMKNLRKWKPDSDDRKPPIPLADDETYLAGFTEGTYRHWSASRQLNQAKSRYESGCRDLAGRRDFRARCEVGLEEKTAAIKKKLVEFQQLKDVLLAHSAKTFKELHPEVEVREHSRHRSIFSPYRSRKDEPFKVTFGFDVSLPSEEVRERYIRLFESVWQGDIKSVKELTVLAWTDSEGEKRSPLQIAVQDEQKSSPLSIAVLAGNFDLARAIMEIAQAQYTPPDPPKARQYHMGDKSDEDCSDDDDDEGDDVSVVSEVIDDQATIEDIGKISLSVKCHIKPEEMLYWTISDDDKNLPGSWAGRGSRAAEPEDLVETALKRDDSQLLNFLLDLVDEYAAKADEGGAVERRCAPSANVPLSSALKLAKPQLLAEFIKRTAAGFPIDELAVIHGANETTEKPKYYQGLNVNGKKRKDWAAAGRNVSGSSDKTAEVSPLLLTAHHGSVEQMEWFLSDAPLRCYKQYAQAHEDDKRLQRLSQVAGGLEGVVKEFLSARSNMAIHCCLAGKQTSDSLEMLKYLTEALPDAVEAKSADGLTPLLLAFRLRSIEAARILIDAGADQTARDKDGMNLLHQMLFEQTEDKDESKPRLLTQLIDPRLISSMCLQRCSLDPGALTPLALWLAQVHQYTKRHVQVAIARLILGYSHGEELSMLNGEGHTPLHVITRDHGRNNRFKHRDLATLILEHRPEMVGWENATGKTPMDLVEDTILACKCCKSGSLTSEQQYAGHYRQSITKTEPRTFVKREFDLDDLLTAHLLNDVNTHPDVDARQRSERLRTSLLDVQAKLGAEGKAGRRLVTLNEASEVARRLAAVQRKRIEKEDEQEATYGQDTTQDSKRDTVEQWINSACRR